MNIRLSPASFFNKQNLLVTQYFNFAKSSKIGFLSLVKITSSYQVDLKVKCPCKLQRVLFWKWDISHLIFTIIIHIKPVLLLIIYFPIFHIMWNNSLKWNNALNTFFSSGLLGALVVGPAGVLIVCFKDDTNVQKIYGTNTNVDELTEGDKIKSLDMEYMGNENLISNVTNVTFLKGCFTPHEMHFNNGAVLTATSTLHDHLQQRQCTNDSSVWR